MKRFFCNTCKRVIRVRRIPTSVTNPFADNPYERIGDCTWHTAGRVHRTAKPTIQKSAPVQTQKRSR